MGRLFLPSVFLLQTAMWIDNQGTGALWSTRRPEGQMPQARTEKQRWASFTDEPQHPGALPLASLTGANNYMCLSHSYFGARDKQQNLVLTNPMSNLTF